MGQPAARVGDMHTCPMFDGPKPHVGGPVLPPGGLTVLVGGQPAARVGDMAVCVGPPDVIAKGSPTVLIGGQFAARMGDLTAHGGLIVMGFPTVLIGEAPSVPGAPSIESFPSADDAARAALNDANPMSIRQNTEYGGLIYRNPDGTFGHTVPSSGGETGFDPGSVSAPPGSTVVGDYHTHGDYSTADANGNADRTSDPAKDDFNSDNFSATDLSGIAADANGDPDYSGYLGTPGGDFKKYTPGSGNPPGTF